MSNMKCSWNLITSSGTWDELSEAQQKEFKKHISSCQECSKIYEDINLLLNSLQSCPGPVPLSLFETRKIISRAIRKEETPFTKGFKTLWKPALAVALSLLIVIGTVFVAKNLIGPGVEEKEVAENIDFLQNMDVIEKIVKVVDNVPHDQSFNVYRGVTVDERRCG